MNEKDVQLSQEFIANFMEHVDVVGLVAHLCQK